MPGRQLADALGPSTGALDLFQTFAEAVAVHHQIVQGAGRRAQQIGAAHSERIELELARHAIEQAFEGMPAIDRAVTAHGTAGRQVGIDPIAVVFDRRNVVDALQQRAGIEDGHDAVAGIGAAALHHLALARRDAAIAPHAELQPDVGLRPRAVGQEGFLARQLHQHLAAGGAGQQRGDDLEIQHLHPRAEPAADERLDHANPRGVHLQATGQHQMQVVDDLGHALKGQSSGQRIVIGQRGVRLDLGVIDLGAAEGRFANEIGRGELLAHIAELVVHLAFEIARLVVVQQRRPGGTRFLRRIIGRELADLELDQLQRVFGGLAIDRGHGRDRLAAVAHPLAGQRVFVHGDRQDAVGVRAVVAGDDGRDARQRPRLRHVEPNDLAVTHRAAENPTDQGIGVFEIRRVARAAGDLVDAVDQRHAGTRGPAVTARSAFHDAISAALRTDSMIFT